MKIARLKKHKAQLCSTCKRYMWNQKIQKGRKEGWKKIYNAKTTQKKFGITILISDNVEFKQNIASS